MGRGGRETKTEREKMKREIRERKKEREMEKKALGPFEKPHTERVPFFFLTCYYSHRTHPSF